MNVFHHDPRFGGNRLRPVVSRLVGVFIALAVCGCAHTETVMVLPKIDLTAYGMIGVITFSSNTQDDLKQYVTDNFMEAAQSAQPGVRLLELGGKERLLKPMARSELDFETIRSLGKTYQVDAVITGHLELSDAKPNLSVRTMPAALRASAYVDATLSTKIWETGSGATIWSQSSSARQSVADVGLRQDGTFRVGVSDPEARFRNLIENLAYENTQDFRPTYIRRKTE